MSPYRVPIFIHFVSLNRTTPYIHHVHIVLMLSSVDNTPHVRIVNFVYAEEKKLVYFATFPDNAKVGEIDANHTVSFTTIPHDGGTAHVRAVGTAAKSKRSIFDLADTSQQRFRATTKQLRRSVTHSLSTRSHFPLRQ